LGETELKMPPIISCMPNSYGRFGAQGAVENLCAAGIEYLELPIRTAGAPTQFGDTPLVTTESTLDDLKRVEQLLEQHCMRLSSCNVTSGNPVDEEIVTIIKRKLDLAGHFGVPLVVGNAGRADDPRLLPLLDRHLREIGDYAARLGIVYCFETHPGLCQNHRSMLETMQRLDHPHLKLNFDTGNILYYNENIVVETALTLISSHVRHVHLKDHTGVFGQWSFPALGHGGAVDFVNVLAVMRCCGFNGPYSIEIEGIEGEPELTIKEHQRRIKDSVTQLKNCGYFD